MPQIAESESGIPPCFLPVPNRCRHVNAEGQDPRSIGHYCQRPRGHALDPIGHIGCPYCLIEMAIRCELLRRAATTDGK